MESMLADAAAYKSYQAHFGDPPNSELSLSPRRPQGAKPKAGVIGIILHQRYGGCDNFAAAGHA